MPALCFSVLVGMEALKDISGADRKRLAHELQSSMAAEDQRLQSCAGRGKRHGSARNGQTIPGNAFVILIGFGGKFRPFIVEADFACFGRGRVCLSA